MSIDAAAQDGESALSRNILFFHIPKTAGRAMMKVLRRHGAVDLEPPTRFRGQRMPLFAHVRILDLVANGILSEAYFRNALKFCFVRNPWDRLVSC